ncbi:4511_t:CDS:2 [Ambispora gerdemannii]|uniref:4511_t:CDS:1 n=1 Tax=Ambispora gerdemannii TaxID=144530 RepID=A0A9N8ZTU0_9GLOM|nr:4511_t:CDS:2 [Ambispora gerdemannii]
MSSPLLENLYEEQPYKTVFFILIFLYILTFYLRYFINTTRLPGPVPFPIVGNFPQLVLLLLREKFNLSQVIQILHLKYGDFFQLYIPFSFRDPVIVISNAQIVEPLFASTSAIENKFHLRTGPRQGINELGISKKGLYLNRDTESWIRNKNFFVHGVGSVNAAKDCVVYASKAFEEMEKSWVEVGSFIGKRDLIAKVDLIEWIFRWTTDIIFQVTLSENVNSIQTYKKIIIEKTSNNEKKSNLNSSFNKLAKSLSVTRMSIDTETFIRNMQNFFPAVWIFLATPKWTRDYVAPVSTMARQFKTSLEVVNKALVKIIKKKREEISGGKAKEGWMDFLTTMITAEEDKVVFSDDDVRENLLHALAGGIITLGNTLCFIIYTITKHPNVKNQLMQEIDSVFKENDILNYEDLAKLKYTEAIIKEALRILPTVPLNLRVAGEDCRIGEHQFKAGTQFILNQQGIHLNPKHWENPTEFDPSRFLSPNSDKNMQKNSLLHFGAGTRKCPGKLLAMTELKCFLALFYQKYDFVIDNVDMNNNKGEWDD